MLLAISAGAAYNECMQYTLRNIPKEVDRELRSRAKREGKSLNEVAIDALRAATGSSDKVKYRDLSDLVGSWVHDEETEKALADQRRIDPEMWR